MKLAKNIFRAFIVTIVCASLLGAEVKWKYIPAYPIGALGWSKIKFDPVRKVYIISDSGYGIASGPEILTVEVSLFA